MDDHKLMFDMLSGSKQIFQDKECLENGYRLTLKDILHRTTEIDTYRQHLSWALEGQVPGNVMVYGKMGTGKTLVTKTVTSSLEQEASKAGITAKSVYIHCGTITTNIQIFRYINNFLTIETGSEKTKTANSFDAYFLKFCDLMRVYKGILIIILDEIDMVDDPDIINLLARIKENGYLDTNVCMIGITNDITFDQTMDARTLSILSQTEIVFPPYDANQLRDILGHRADMAFVPNAVQETVIPLCAALAAQEHGDARKAIELLRVSGIIAVEKNDKQITETHVKMANERIERDKVTELIRTLPTHSKITLLSCLYSELHKKQVSYTGELYSVYKRICNELGMESLTQRRITDLLSELSAIGLINAVEISRGRFGRTKEVTLSIPIQSSIDVLRSDFRIKQLSNDFFCEHPSYQTKPF